MRGGHTPGGIGRVDETLRQQRAEPGEDRDVGGIGDRERGFHHREVLRRAVVEEHEAAVAGESRSDDDVVRSAVSREASAFLERLESEWVTRAVLRVAQADEQIAAFGLGPIQLDRDVERDAVVARGFGGGQVLERVVTGAYRPPSSFGRPPGERVVTSELHHHPGRELVDVLLQRASGEPVQVRAAIRCNRSETASNVRNRSVASSDSVGAGVVATHVASDGQMRSSSPPCRATCSARMATGA